MRTLKDWFAVILFLFIAIFQYTIAQDGYPLDELETASGPDFVIWTDIDGVCMFQAASATPLSSFLNDLSPGSDDQTITRFERIGSKIYLEIENDPGEYLISLPVDETGSDDQRVINFAVYNGELLIQLEDDDGGEWAIPITDIIDASLYQTISGTSGWDKDVSDDLTQAEIQVLIDASTHWTKVGNVIYYAGGNIGYVGINTTNPTSLLTVYGPTNLLDARGTVTLNGLGLYQTGYYNTWLSKNAGFSSTSSADYNFAAGLNALYSNTTGDNNTSIGRNALYSNTTGNNNTGIGFGAGFSATTANGCTYIGQNAGYYNNTDNRFYLSGTGFETRPLLRGEFDNYFLEMMTKFRIRNYNNTISLARLSLGYNANDWHFEHQADGVLEVTTNTTSYVDFQTQVNVEELVIDSDWQLQSVSGTLEINPVTSTDVVDINADMYCNEKLYIDDIVVNGTITSVLHRNSNNQVVHGTIQNEATFKTTTSNNVTTTTTTLSGFAEQADRYSDFSVVSGNIQTPESGVYDVTLTINYTGVTTSKEFDIELYDVTGSTVVESFEGSLYVDATINNDSKTLVFTNLLIANRQYSIRLRLRSGSSGTLIVTKANVNFKKVAPTA